MNVDQNKCSASDESVSDENVEFLEVVESLESFASDLSTNEGKNCSESSSDSSCSKTPSTVLFVGENSSETEPLPSESEDSEEKFDRNLQRFLKDSHMWNNIRLRKKTKAPVRNIKSDGEIGKIIDFCGNMSQMSSLLSKVSSRSSAPPTFNCETESKQKVRYEKLFGSLKSRGKSSNDEGEFRSDTSSENESNPDSVKVSETESNKSSKKTSEVFKAPFSPSQIASTSTSFEKVKPKDVVTPVHKRPKDFNNVGARKAFYTFSPECGSDVVRLCQSMPNLHRPKRKDGTQRHSINFGEHSRIVRSLFKDNPEPSTPASQMSTFVGKRPLDQGDSEPVDNEASKKVSMEVAAKKSAICRKLIFSAPEEKNKETLPVSENIETVSPSKRKDMSPVVSQYTAAFAKRVRTSAHLKGKRADAEKTELTNSEPEETKDHLKPGCSRVQGSSPLKRKAEDEEYASSSSTEGTPSKIVARK